MEEKSRRSNLQAQGYFRMTENMGSDEARPRRPPYLPAWLRAPRPLSPFFGALHSRSNIPLPPCPPRSPSLIADRPPFSCMRRVPLFPHSLPTFLVFLSSTPFPISFFHCSRFAPCLAPSLALGGIAEVPRNILLGGCSKRLEEASASGGGKE